MLCDHNLLLATLRLRFKKVTRSRRTPIVDTHKLKDKIVKTEVKNKIYMEISKIKENQHYSIVQK